VLVSDKKQFAMAHMIKTGGRWLSKVVVENAPKHWEASTKGRMHKGAIEVDPKYSVFGFIRNPWDFYVSLYFFFRKHFEDGTGGYNRPASEWIPQERYFAHLLLSAPEGGDGFKEAMPHIVNHPLYSMRYSVETILRSDGRHVEIGRFENLREDSIRLLEWASKEQLTPKLRQAILTESPINSSRHGNYRDYYDQELIDLVAEGEKGIIDEFGYDF
jgi:hypothetical protein